jgi:hypothetical protein
LASVVWQRKADRHENAIAVMQMKAKSGNSIIQPFGDAVNYSAHVFECDDCDRSFLLKITNNAVVI